MTHADKPAQGESFTDPQFGTRITRITNSGQDEVIKPWKGRIT
jgi:hypothetical protein